MLINYTKKQINN